MKIKLLSLSRTAIAAQGLLVSFAFLLCASASAAELLKNGDFEQRLGPTNWTVMYLHGDADDFEIKSRIRAASVYPQDSVTKFFGGCFRPLTIKLAVVRIPC